MLNRIGYFYLSNLIRVREALAYFERSLRLSPSQPKIAYTVDQLKDDYLVKLKDPWNQGPS